MGIFRTRAAFDKSLPTVELRRVMTITWAAGHLVMGLKREFASSSTLAPVPPLRADWPIAMRLLPRTLLHMSMLAADLHELHILLNGNRWGSRVSWKRTVGLGLLDSVHSFDFIRGNSICGYHKIRFFDTGLQIIVPQHLHPRLQFEWFHTKSMKLLSSIIESTIPFETMESWKNVKQKRDDQ